MAAAAAWGVLAVSAAHGDEAFRARVAAVYDGDTIGVLHGGRAEKIRLQGIDCPEKGQPFFAKAKEFTAKMAAGKEVLVVISGGDKYGRAVGEVVLDDGRSLSRELVKAGLAWWYEIYAPRDLKLKALQAEAKAARRGLWQDPGALPPWKSRHP